MTDKDSVLTVISDAILLYRFSEGDDASFEELFRRHYDMVYGVLFRLTGTRQEAEDLAQEVFLKLYKQPLKHGENVAGWLYRVALNTGYNRLRSTRRREYREQIAGRELLTERTAHTEEEVTRRETQRRVRAALAAIPPRAAHLLVLREMGCSYREIAEIIDVSPTSIGTLLARAQQAFQAAYGE